MTTKTETNTAMSIRNAYAQREPAGRAAVGGNGVWCCGRGAGEGTGRSGLGERQLPARRVVIEKLGVATPLDSRLQLPARFVFAEMFIQQVLEKLRGQRAIRFRFQRLLHLTKQGNVGQHGFAEYRFAPLDVRMRKGFPVFCEDGVA